MKAWTESAHACTASKRVCFRHPVVRADHEGPDDANDLEHTFFKKFERRNWTLSLFEGAGRWGIRINPVSFGVSVIVIWGFAVRCCFSPDPCPAAAMLHHIYHVVPAWCLT